MHRPDRLIDGALGKVAGEMQGLDFLLKAAIDNPGDADPCHRKGTVAAGPSTVPHMPPNRTVLDRIEHRVGRAAVTQLELSWHYLWALLPRTC